MDFLEPFMRQDLNGEAGLRAGLRRLGEGLIDPLIEGARTISRYCAWAGGAIFFASAILITVEVFIRKFLSLSLGGADELSGYGFAVAVTFGFACAALDRAHIRVDTFHNWLSERGKAILDIVAAVLLLVYFGSLLQYGYRVVIDTWQMNAHSNTPLHVPLIVPQTLWWLGLVLTVAVSALLLFRACLHLALGALASSSKLIGARGMEEELSDELSALDQQTAAGKTAP
jgi:TRAP-type C4-dicarboxylate transport system permease small subunit